MRKRPVFAVVLIVLLGLSILGLRWCAKIFGDNPLLGGGPKIYLDEKAREVLRNSKLRPSPAATDIYCYHAGFQDPIIYFSYTDSPDYLRSIIESRTGRKIEEMESFPPNDSSVTDEFGSPGKYDKKYLTPLFDLRSVRKGVYHLGKDGNDPWYVIWDTEHNRLYYRYFGT